MGELYSIGQNSHGQLGLGDTTDRTTLTQVGAVTTWDSVSCGEFHTFAKRSDGTIWSAGWNNSGELGLGDHIERTTFVEAIVGAVSIWDSVVCGAFHTFAIGSDGTLWSTGNNSFGQLGRGNTVEIDEFRQVGALTTWSSVACGRLHTAAIKTDGTLWVTGRNEKGELGLGDTTERDSFVQVGALTTWSSVACNGRHTVAIKTDGTIWSTGWNENGQLGLGNTTDGDTFVQIGALTTWDSVACGGKHTLAIKTDGTLWGTGANWSGQLGVGDGVQRESFAQAGSSTSWTKVTGALGYFSLALQNNTLYGAGDNSDYQLLDGTATGRHPFTVSTVTDCGDMSCSTENGAALGGFTVLVTAGSTPTPTARTSAGAVLFNGLQYVGDYNSGTVFQLSMDAYTDAGIAISRIRRTQIINKERVNVIHNKIEIDFEHGVAQTEGSNPQATLKWSDDEGHTWSEGRLVSIGGYEEYGARTIWRNLGKSRNRIYELAITNPVKVIITGAYATLKACKF